MAKKFLLFGIALIALRVMIPDGQEVATPESASSEAAVSAASKLETTLARLRFDSLGTVYRSGQPDSAQLEYLLRSRPIDVVIRLNSKDYGLSVEEEAAICDRHKVRFYLFNIEGDSYRVYRQIHNLLSDGNVLLHCRHGYDRTGVIWGLWMKEMGYSDADIINQNDWEYYIERKGEPYRKYWDAVFYSSL